MKTHGGRRTGSGRKKKPGWGDKFLRLELPTSQMLAEVAHECRMSQSAIANNLLVKELKKFLKRHRNSQE
ncbi:MAG TPA: hypothetical protein VGJ30_19140 [Candidatus Angelobacter sp.]|jgi:hypothetical protein